MCNDDFRVDCQRKGNGDHELVAGIETDCKARRERKKNKKPMRFLLTIGGAGAQKEIFAHIIRYLLPMLSQKKQLFMLMSVIIKMCGMIWNVKFLKCQILQ